MDTILVADDDRMARVLLTRTLRGWGLETVLAADGDAACQALCAPDGPRIALVDWLMPGMDGLALCRTVRQLRPRVHLILVTVRAAPEDLIQAFAAGATDFLAKPFDLGVLHARLRVAQRMARLFDHLDCLGSALAADDLAALRAAAEAIDQLIPGGGHAS